ncbi:MAG: carboxypeptidase-like regulatory domain-containing protein [Bacteroidetes bacterium]|nr:carboxypeptidase-like regulatory domain-containing protein [Bacteroidota bacterium]MBS1740025.1 carboxypeptidase-like regulatory domain-containing protein [Bacteroidota bacterium]
MRSQYILLWCLFISVTGQAQILRGRVLDGDNKKPLPTVSVYNAKTQQYVFTNALGYFSLEAKPGDLISFSLSGYRIQTKSVAELNAEMFIDLFKLSYVLDEFVYRPKYSAYQLDSMERKSTYANALSQRRTGNIMSPVTFLAERLSKTSKQRYRFQKNFNYWEDEKFIESRYSPAMVKLLTSLRGDTVAYFMNANPMPYDFARAASDLEIKMWIREHYKVWIKNPQYPQLDSVAQH